MSIEKVRAYFRALDTREGTGDSSGTGDVQTQGGRFATGDAQARDGLSSKNAVQTGQGLEGRILEFPVSSATVELAAQALGVEPARIAKSLSFKIDDKPLLIVAAGDARIDNPAYKARFHAKAKMLSHEEAHTFIGHDVGGVCPFALPPDVPVYLDESLRRFSTVYPAAGSGSSAIELTCGELERYASNFSGWVDVCKGWRGEGAC